MVASSGVHEPHGVFRAIDAGLKLQEESEGFHPWALHLDPSGTSFNGRQRNRLFIAGEDGTFRDLSVMMGADSSLDGRSMVAADFDSEEFVLTNWGG